MNDFVYILLELSEVKEFKQNNPDLWNETFETCSWTRHFCDLLDETLKYELYVFKWIDWSDVSSRKINDVMRTFNVWDFVHVSEKRTITEEFCGMQYPLITSFVGIDTSSLKELH